MIALLSNGITSKKLHNELSKHIKGTKAAIVVTADNEYKSENYHIPRCIKELNALVLTPSIAIIDKYSPEMNIVGISNLSGLSLTDTYILPHYSKFLNRYENFEEKCKQYELDNRLQVIRLNDGERIIIFGNNKLLIK